MKKKFEMVRLSVDIPEKNLHKGDTGTIVEIFTTPSRAYEVEFTDDDGNLIALVTLSEDDLFVTDQK